MTWFTFLKHTFEISEFNLQEQVTSFNLSSGFIFTKYAF